MNLIGAAFLAGAVCLAVPTNALAQDSAGISLRIRNQTVSGSSATDLQGSAGTRAVGTSITSEAIGLAMSSSGSTVLVSGPWPALVGAAPDTDRDSREDANDNCTATPNPGQLDTDSDSFGDACDCDFDGDGTCGIGDFNIFLADFQAQSDSGAGTDMNGDGSVGIQDFNLFLPGFQAGKPGPSGLREECGLAVCDAGLECCNPVAGICVAPGLVCTQ